MNLHHASSSASAKKGLKIVFAGTPAFGLPVLEALNASPHQLQAVYTQPDRPSGRGQKMVFSPIKSWAQAHHIEVFQPQNFKSEAAIQALESLAPDLMIVIAYGLILPQRVLAIPRLGCINVHASLLPAWRGASPIQASLLNGDNETGITIMQMDAGMDTGDILSLTQLPLTGKETAGSLHDALSQLAVSPLLETLTQLQAGSHCAVAQDHSKASYTKKITKQDAWIDWSRPAKQIESAIRAFQPWPVAYTHYEKNTLRIFDLEILDRQASHPPGTLVAISAKGIEVATGDQCVLITRLQSAGGKVLAIDEWFRGHSTTLTEGRTFSAKTYETV